MKPDYQSVFEFPDAELIARAIAAYDRTDEPDEYHQPVAALCEVWDVDGKMYISLSNKRGLLAVYRAHWVNSAWKLKRLHGRWPTCIITSANTKKATEQELRALLPVLMDVTDDELDGMVAIDETLKADVTGCATFRDAYRIAYRHHQQRSSALYHVLVTTKGLDRLDMEDIAYERGFAAGMGYMLRAMGEAEGVVGECEPEFGRVPDVLDELLPEESDPDDAPHHNALRQPEFDAPDWMIEKMRAELGMDGFELMDREMGDRQRLLEVVRHEMNRIKEAGEADNNE